SWSHSVAPWYSRASASISALRNACTVSANKPPKIRAARHAVRSLSLGLADSLLFSCYSTGPSKDRCGPRLRSKQFLHHPGVVQEMDRPAGVVGQRRRQIDAEHFVVEGGQHILRDV